MNYQALGEYHAFKKQATDAANKRFALLYNLSNDLRKIAENAEKPMDMEAINDAIKEAKAAETEMIAAIGCANEAAALCGESKVSVSQFCR